MFSVPFEIFVKSIPPDINIKLKIYIVKNENNDVALHFTQSIKEYVKEIGHDFFKFP